MSVRNIIKKIIPSSCILAARRFLYSLTYIYRSISYRKRLKYIRKKEVVNVSFFVLFDSTWKLDYLYRMLSESPSFNVSVVVCPIVNFGHDNMLKKMEETYGYFKSLGYNVLKAYDKDTDTYLDVKKELDPDVIFYTSPYRGQVDDRYFISEYYDRLTFYVPYFFNEINAAEFINHPTHNFAWKFFVETPFHAEFCRKNMFNCGRNVQLSGYPGVDFFLDKDYVAKDRWKLKDKKYKRIIWAPHHTILPTDVLYYSCFLIYSDFMLKMARKYSDSIQIAFKPHPVLRNKLNDYWGTERTDAYYKEWETLENTFFENGEYIDLFLTSDAMIHDSGSFLVEYLYVDKPVMRTDNGRPMKDEFNDFIMECMEHYYHARSEEDIENFIVDVIEGRDVKRDTRREFCSKTLNTYNGQLPSYNIYEYLINEFRK